MDAGLSRTCLQAMGRVCPPQHGRVLQRERLFRALDSLTNSPALWIHGIPGIGKTTLVATYLEARDTACMWLRLDASVSDPVVFLQFLNLALSDATLAQEGTLSDPADDDLNDVVGLFRATFSATCQYISIAMGSRTGQLSGGEFFLATLCRAGSSA